ncbi:hypothetical protein PGUG_00506 [Meyerozyma guilliermondii ATCC 6260]|nr:uncharacterized protein PGUG_00506 [Meyerozyma guilliermondii ATCC 6260]EDK36408.2 hypothetical protein PGUG_00506 [Meyerozyma guilliermondii ATCC 6260]
MIPKLKSRTVKIMFTGLVEHIGTVLQVTEKDTTASGGDGVSMVIGDCSKILEDVQLGDSICTNGVCLTVTEFDMARSQFKVGISPETLRRSDLGELKPGSKVNLERAVKADVRMGGHVVQGHVDTIATIVNRRGDGNAINFTFKLRDSQYGKYIVEKGFIAIDGTSLTVTDVDHEQSEFSISMVSYTQEKVIMPLKNSGDSVNIEVDLTGKLIEKQIELSLLSYIKDETSPLSTLIGKLVEKKVDDVLKRN